MSYICKIATIEEIEQNFNYLIEIHPGNNAWKIYKNEAIKRIQDGNAIVYYGIQNGVIISEVTVMFSNLDVNNSDGLVDDTTAYLSAFRTRKEYQGKGYFSKLYHFVENDLKNRGYKRLTLGVEPCEVKNMMIYFKYGFKEFVKTAYETEPAKNENDEPTKYLVNYYAKNLTDNQTIELNHKGKVIVVCGKICSGKSYYSKKIQDSLKAVIISPDEATYELINNEQGEFYNIFSERLNKYLTKKVGEIASVGANVIFERGLWTKNDRKAIKEYYRNIGIECEIHYVCVDDETWMKNISERNQRIEEGKGGADFYLDEGLLKKLESIDVWHIVQR